MSPPTRNHLPSTPSAQLMAGAMNQVVPLEHRTAPANYRLTASLKNNIRMKSWLLERYASSTFNTCPHRASMHGRPPCRDSHRPIGNTESVPQSGQDTTTLAGTCTPRPPVRRGSRRDRATTLRRACHVVSSHGHHSDA